MWQGLAYRIAAFSAAVRFEKVNASVGNGYLCKGMGRKSKEAVVGMGNQTLP